MLMLLPPIPPIWSPPSADKVSSATRFALSQRMRIAMEIAVASKRQIKNRRNLLSLGP